MRGYWLRMFSLSRAHDAAVIVAGRMKEIRNVQ